MDHSSASDAGRAPASYDLAALFGLKGSLRLLPQGVSPKAHILLKREYPKDDSSDSGTSTSVARFTFVANKRFNATKGQTLLLSVLDPAATDPKDSSLFCEDNTFFVECDLNDESEAKEDEQADRARIGKDGIGYLESLPPKLRKSLLNQKTYDSFIEREPPNRVGFQGYPLAPDKYKAVSTQTDIFSPTSPIDLTSSQRALPSLVEYSDRSPLQLPSPVSADHMREPHLDALAQLESDETDNCSRTERSLSPMELSTPSTSCRHSPVPLPHVTPEQAARPLIHKASPLHIAVPVGEDVMDVDTLDRTMTPPPVPTAVDVPSAQAADGSTSEARQAISVSSEEPFKAVPLKSPIPEPTSEIQADSTTPAEELKVVPVNITLDAVEPQKEITEKGAVLATERPPSARNAEASSSKLPINQAIAARTVSIPIMPRAMTQRSGRALEKSPAVVPSNHSLPPSASIKLANTSTSFIPPRPASPPPDPKALAYIPSGSLSNPLGIRPSANPALAKHVIIQKTVPKAPRCLTGTTAAPAKKPVVVGAKWSAVRASSTSSSNASSNGGLSASSSSSSALTSVPSSPAISSPTPPQQPPPPPPPPAPAPAVKGDLSQILRYASPTPPPPPELDAPPPLPPQPPANKWKPIASVDDERPVVVNGTKKTAQLVTKMASQVICVPPQDKHAAPTAAGSTTPTSTTTASKRPFDSLTKARKGQPEPEAQPPKRLKAPSLTPSTSTSSATSNTAKPPPAPPSQPAALKLGSITQKLPQPLKHPLPPKPVHAGSSYRPLKRERSRSRERERDTDRNWPSTEPDAFEQLRGASNTDLGVKKIAFSSDGRLIAVICADRTLRIWENEQKPSEVARLAHNAAIADVCWMNNGSTVMTLGVDGVVSTWTRNGTEWKFGKLLTVYEAPLMEDGKLCMAYAKDRIAVSTPAGVKVWLLISGTWQSQREIVRSGVTAIRFVQDGNALIGGCSDGILWYCEVPNGTLRVHCFLPLKKNVTSLDIHPNGTQLLVGQEGGTAYLVSMKANETRGAVERYYTSEKVQAMTQKGFPAIFSTAGQAVVFGITNGCALVWDRRKGSIVYGLKHPKDDLVQAIASFDGRAGVEGLMVSGTKEGRLFWWPRPQAAPSHPGSHSTSTSDEVHRKRQKLGLLS